MVIDKTGRARHSIRASRDCEELLSRANGPYEILLVELLHLTPDGTGKAAGLNRKQTLRKSPFPVEPGGLCVVRIPQSSFSFISRLRALDNLVRAGASLRRMCRFADRSIFSFLPRVMISGCDPTVRTLGLSSSKARHPISSP